MVRQKPASESLQFGLWQSIPHPAVSRYLAKMRWNFVVLDLQHGPMSSETAYECIHVLRDNGTEPWVRVSIGQPSEVQRALDLGAQAVVVPLVNSVQQAHEMVRAAKYPPAGERSIGGDFEIQQGPDYPERANQATRLLVQIEHRHAVQEVEEIMSIPGVDGCFVGPTDLAVSMGLARQHFANDPELQAALRRTLAATRAQGKAACCNTYSLEDARQRIAEGYGWITFQSDVDLLIRAGSELLQDLRRL